MSSKKLLSEQKGDGDDTESAPNVGGDGMDEDDAKQSAKADVDSILDSDDADDVELGNSPSPDSHGLNGENGITAVSESKDEEKQNATAPSAGKDGVSLKGKWKNVNIKQQ